VLPRPSADDEINNIKPQFQRFNIRPPAPPPLTPREEFAARISPYVEEGVVSKETGLPLYINKEDWEYFSKLFGPTLAKEGYGYSEKTRRYMPLQYDVTTNNLGQAAGWSDKHAQAIGQIARADFADAMEKFDLLMLGAGAVKGVAGAGLGAFLTNGPQSVNPGKLIFDPVTKSWRSNAGLVYEQGSAQGNRVLHVLDHISPNPSKPLHTLFNVDRTQLIGLIDEAWAARQGAGLLQANGNRVFDVAMGRVVGAGGETTIRIVIRDGTTKVRTAYPIP
jgi:hypothetical protein